MALTLTKKEFHSQGDLRGSSARITFDNSYAVGGESLTPQMLGLGQFVGDIVFPQGEQGFTFQWDRDNNKIIVLGASAPQLVVEEVVSFSSDIGTLRYPPAYIVAITDTTNNVGYRTIPTGESPANNVSVAVTYTSGLLTKHSSETDSDVIHVTYFPQRSGTFFSLENMVIDEEVTLLAAGVDLANRAAVVQDFYGDTTGIFAEINVTDTAATGELILDINNSGATTFKSNSAQDDETAKVTYLKYSGLDSQVAFTDDTSITLNSQDYNFTTDGSFLVDQLQVPGYGTLLVGIGGGGTGDNENAIWAGPSEAESSTICSWTPATNNIETANTGTTITTRTSWLTVQLNVADAVRPDRLVEIEDGRDLSSLVIDVYARGR